MSSVSLLFLSPLSKMASSPDHFAPPTTSSRHLYGSPAFSTHRRTLSNTAAPVPPFPSQKGAHRRTFSNNASDLQRILAGSPPASSGKSTETVPKLPAKVVPPPTKSGFVGMLDAAITYFDGSSPVQTTEFQPSADHDLSGVVSTLESRICALEVENEGLKLETKRLASQRENYITHIGTLNTQLLDLQLAFEEEKQRKSGKTAGKEPMESLDLSEVRRGGESPRDKKGEGRGSSKGKPPTPAKGNSGRRELKGTGNCQY